MEKLANFDRERIPERVVHARGASAKGFFEVTHNVSHLTCADFLRAPGVQTPVIVRFSTVVHERGSPETIRDPRGFAVKFYTREVRIYCDLPFSSCFENTLAAERRCQCDIANKFKKIHSQILKKLMITVHCLFKIFFEIKSTS